VEHACKKEHARRIMKSTMILLMAMISIYAAHLQAMQRDNTSFLQVGLKRMGTTLIAVGAGQCIEESTLPEEIKVPLYVVAFTGGTYGFDWDNPPPVTNNTSLLLSLTSTTIALAGSWYLLRKTSLSDQHKARVFAALCGINLWRLCKAIAKEQE
jgi:hypothetical protein